MIPPRRLAVACCGLMVLGAFCGCKSGGSSLEQELPPELLDVLPLSEKRPVEVVMASPQGDLEQLDQAQSLVMAFNQPMVPLKPVSTDSSVDFVEITPAVAGRFRWKGTATLVFEPKQKLPYATRYQIKVKRGLKSWSQQALIQDYSFTFTTPTVALERSLPAQGGESQGLGEPMYLHFNQPVRPEDIKKSLKLSQGDQDVEVEVRAYTEEDRQAETKTAELQNLYDLPKENGLVQGAAEAAVVVRPLKPLKAGAPTSLRLLPGVVSPGGSEKSTLEKSWTFTTRRPFGLDKTQVTQDPESGLCLEFTTPVSPAEVRKALTIEPKLELPEFEVDSDYASSSCYLGGQLLPNTTYTVKLDASLLDRYQEKIQGARELVLKTSDYMPQLLGPEGSGVLELQGQHKIPLGIRNQAGLTAGLRKLTPPEVIALSSSESGFNSSDDYVPPGGFTQTLQLGGNQQRNQVEQRELPLPGGGLYFVKATAGGLRQKSLVACTEVSLTAKYAAENLLLYATRLQDASPVAQAQITLYDQQGRQLWQGQTNAEGFCQAPGWAQLGLKKSDSWSPPDLWAFIKSGASESFVHSQGYNSVGPWAFDIDYTTDQVARRFQAFAFSERGVYRPGESVQFKGSLRELVEGSWKLPNVEQVHYKVIDSRDREVTKGQVPVNRFGGFDQSLALKSGAVTGLYRCEYHLPEALAKSLMVTEPVTTVAFQVEAFKPAQFEVQLKPNQDHFIMGDKAEVEAKGWYLFGAPMNERPLTWTARVEPSSLRPEGFEGYDFGLDWSGEAQDESKELGSGETKLDEHGLADIALDLSKIPYKGSAELWLEATATSPNRQSLSGRKAIPLYRGEFQLGLRQQSTFVQAGQAHSLEVVAVKPGGDTLQGVNVKLELLRRQWNSLRKADESGGYRWVTETKDEVVSYEDLRTSTRAVKGEFTPPKSGYYVVRASAKDSRGNNLVSESGFYATGTDYVAWAREEDDTVRLVSDKKEYKPGDTATIMIKSPYEKTKALVTIERDHIMDRFVTELKGTAPTLEIPLTARHLPNVYVSVILLQGRREKQEFGPEGQDLSKPGFKMGYINLPVAAGEKRLQVKVSTDKEKYAPGEEVVANFEVTDSSGAGVESEICVAVPDQGVLALTGYTLPDWFQAFYGPRPLAVTTMENRMDVIGQRAYGVKGANPGGGGGFDGGDARDDFRYTAYWNPSLSSDAQGKAQARFKLPDNLTTFKVMALAQTATSKFGSAESKLLVQKPLQLQASAPDFARLGDDFQAGVVVRNNSNQKLAISVTASTQGLELSGDTSENLNLAAGKEKEVLFHFKASKLNSAKLTFQASASGHQDSLTLPLEVQQSLVLENVGTSGSTTEPTAVEMVVPSPMAPGSGILRLFLSSSALVGLEEPLRQIQECRYVGLEPTVSKIRVALAASRLSQALDQGSTEVSLGSWIDSLASYQVGERGFAPYTFEKRPDAYLTAYTVETLERAQQAGTKFDLKLLEAGRAYLKDFLNQTEAKPIKPAEFLLSQCFGLYALSLQEFDGLPYFNNFLRRRRDIPLEGRVYLLLAGRRLGADPSDLALLEQELRNEAKVEAATTYFKERDEAVHFWTFASSNKLTALSLQALLASPKGYPQASKVVAWLMEARDKRGDWGDTHDNARVLEALTSYFTDQEKDKPNFEVVAFVGKEQVQKTSFLGRGLKVEKSSTPIASSVERLAVGLKKVGTGRLYYQMLLSYAAAKEPPARDEGLAVLKKISNLKGDHFPAQLKAGQTYLVTLTVVTPRDRRFVVINDPVPAGCEVVQTQFETESAEMERILASSGASGNSSTFGHFERYADRVALFSDGLQAGEHTFQYLIRANQPGKFTLPATKAEEIYHPEIFGTTIGRIVEIK